MGIIVRSLLFLIYFFLLSYLLLQALLLTAEPWQVGLIMLYAVVLLFLTFPYFEHPLEA